MDGHILLLLQHGINVQKKRANRND